LRAASTAPIESRKVMDEQTPRPPRPARPVGKIQWEIMRKLRAAKGQSLKMPKGSTVHTKSMLRAIRALEAKGIVVVAGDRYIRVR
jgi:hypothetical protein